MAGALHIRNVWSGPPGTNSRGARLMIYLLRETYKLSDWVEDYFDADAAWDSNILLNISDLELDSAFPAQASSVIGGFLQSHENKILSIEGNDTNRGMYNIKTVIDTNTVLLDLRIRTAAWSDQSGVTARIIDPKASLVADNKHIVWREPTLGLQVEWWPVGAVMYGRIYPYADYLTTARYTSTHSLDIGYYSENMRFNAYLGDPASANYFCTWFPHYYGNWSSMIWGKLSNVAVGDNYPFFIQETCITGNWQNANYSPMYMLNEVDSLVSAYPYFYKRAWNYNYADWRMRRQLTQRLNGGRAKKFRPQVLMRDGGSGQFMRGNHPMEYVHYAWPNDEFGTSYWKMGNNVLYPRNGPEDLKPLASVVW